MFFFLSLATQSVRWLAPFTKEELAMRGIVDMISDLTYLKTLYPNISLQKVFLTYVREE